MRLFILKGNLCPNVGWSKIVTDYPVFSRVYATCANSLFSKIVSHESVIFIDNVLTILDSPHIMTVPLFG